MLSLASKTKLATCHADLIRLFVAVSKMMPIVIVCGHRDEAGQNAAVKAGKSKTPYPTSKHNSLPSMAADVAPYPIQWDNKQAFVELRTIVLLVAQSLKIKVRHGADWDMDGKPGEPGEWDAVHWELI